jgi:hypothetical protein
MMPGSTSSREGSVSFVADRGELLGIMARGYLGMLPTLGLYRFWMVTGKRRFYWSHTEIDGDALEYTGNARQLLIGFLMAVVVFLPVYGLLFFLSTQSSELVLIGYGVVGIVLWSLIGYAINRSRDFKLSRTLWRGIRFDQKGSAMGYALRRFGWSVLMVLTAGLVYPFMAGNLWSYRYRNTWFGDRQFGFAGSWKTVAGPYYAIYGIAAAIVIGAGADLIGRNDYIMVKGSLVPNWPIWLAGTALILLIYFGVYFYRAREISRMFSSIRIGDCAVSVVVRGRDMFAQFMLYGAALSGALTTFAMVFGIIIASILAPLLAKGGTPQTADLARIVQGSVLNFVVLLLGYLALLATFAILAEVVLGFGYWKLVARHATITDIDSLKSVRAGPEDRSLVGEGIASALNLGAY